MRIKLLLLSILLNSGIHLMAQSEKSVPLNDGLLISLGYGIHSNSLNRNTHLELKDENYSHIENLQTLSLKIAIPTKRNFIDLFVGVLIEQDLLDDSSSGYTPGRTNSHRHVLNGGGVFAGVRPVWKNRNFGLTGEFGLGAFSFKESYSHFNNISEPFTDLHMEKNTLVWEVIPQQVST